MLGEFKLVSQQYRNLSWFTLPVRHFTGVPLSSIVAAFLCVCRVSFCPRRRLPEEMDTADFSTVQQEQFSLPDTFTVFSLESYIVALPLNEHWQSAFSKDDLGGKDALRSGSLETDYRLALLVMLNGTCAASFAPVHCSACRVTSKVVIKHIKTKVDKLSGGSISTLRNVIWLACIMIWCENKAPAVYLILWI